MFSSFEVQSHGSWAGGNSLQPVKLTNIDLTTLHSSEELLSGVSLTFSEREGPFHSL
jgi:hypothetical protein